MGAYFKWKIVLIGAKLDLITFATSMWSFTVMLTVPLILLLFIAATTLGGEINEGQMLLDCLLYTSPSPRDVEESRLPAWGC